MAYWEASMQTANYASPSRTWLELRCRNHGKLSRRAIADGIGLSPSKIVARHFGFELIYVVDVGGEQTEQISRHASKALR
jgi:hypothetical protein